MSFLEILYFPEGDAGPVRDHLNKLAVCRPVAYIKLALDLQLLGADGLSACAGPIRTPFLSKPDTVLVQSGQHS